MGRGTREEEGSIIECVHNAHKSESEDAFSSLLEIKFDKNTALLLVLLLLFFYMSCISSIPILGEMAPPCLFVYCMFKMFSLR